MKKVLLVLAGLAILAIGVQAQQKKSTNRLEAQHHYNTRWLEQHLGQSEESIISALKSESPSMQATAVQTARELEQLFPQYPFSNLIDPLGGKLRDEGSDSVVRKLAALALDELHSDAGDAVIKGTADSCKDEGVRTLCQALQVKSLNK